MDPTSKKTKKIVIIGAIAYVVASMVFGAFILISAFNCVSEGVNLDDSSTTECIEEVDSQNTIFQALFGLVQLVGVGFIIYLLVQHHNKRREMYGHNPYQNAALDQQMQQQQQQRDQQAAQAPQPPVQEAKDDDQKQ